MTGRAHEIEEALTSLTSAVKGHLTRTERAVVTTENRALNALEHGWVGLNQGYESAAEHLTETAGELQGVRDQINSCIKILHPIRDDTGLRAATERLHTAAGELEAGLDGILTRLHEARTLLEATGEEHLIGILQDLIEQVQESAEALATVEKDLAAEVEEASCSGTEESPLGTWISPAQRSGPQVNRDIDDGESLRGATKAQVADAAQRAGWHFRGRSRDGNGDVWFHPTRKGEQIIINDGYPGANDPTHAGPYVKISRNGTKQRYPLSGEPS
ncbi:hypothetical protein [Kineosporia sp. NBRC 101731]|uniref:hypothetical protein n=1 Tax=Kineosporia sp. NBRC 101731 TaxID=3032199 RepID=UPI0024A1E55E|nr:hypothetical protein [Kineosporia sp. NBRC 101731]GLY31430.1 hypothetical protein Kisp02_47950 [Kineosporia sp. NBRC 101731]